MLRCYPRYGCSLEYQHSCDLFEYSPEEENEEYSAFIPVLGKKMTQKGGCFYGERHLKNIRKMLPEGLEVGMLCFQSRGSYRTFQNKGKKAFLGNQKFGSSLQICSILFWTVLGPDETPRFGRPRFRGESQLSCSDTDFHLFMEVRLSCKENVYNTV